MKNLLIISLTFFTLHNLFSQDFYKQRYKISDSINYKKSPTVYLMVKDENSEIIQKTKICGADTVITTDTIPRRVTFNDLHPNMQPQLPNVKGRITANVKFDGKYIYANPWLKKNDSSNYSSKERNKIYFYELENRKTLSLPFTQWSLNALSVPLKVRIGRNVTEYSTGANLGAFIGHTWGRTSFFHRLKVDNKQFESKLTTGLFLGADKLEFKFKREDNNEVTVKTAALSVGTGVLYSYQKFTVGLTGGLDFALGQNSSKWLYQGKPWIGFSLGYSLFSF